MTYKSLTGIDPVDAANRLGRLIDRFVTDDGERDVGHELVERIAMFDGLTNLINKTFLELRLKEEFARAVRQDYLFSAAMVDIDHFKQYNDKYGHPQGDVALRHAAEVLSSINRESDVLGRYGGEEFLFLLPNTDIKSAEKFAGRVAKIMRSSSIDSYVGDEDSREKKYLGEKGFQNLTVSVGITTFPTITSLPDSKLLTQHADSALYVAKEAGRDRYAVFNPNP